MATIGQLVTRVQNEYSKGVASDDSRLSDRLIYATLVSMRAYLIQNKFEKKGYIAESNFMFLNCLSIMEVDSNADCLCMPVKGCPTLRSTKLPQLLSVGTENGIQAVYTSDGANKLTIGTRESTIYASGNKYTAKATRAFFENSYLYITGKNIPKVVKVKALPRDPLEFKNYNEMCNNCQECEANCYDITTFNFPIDGDLEPALIDMTTKELLTKFAVAYEDQTNNSTDSLKEQSK